MRRTIVTGFNGGIGSSLTDALLKQGDSVIGVGRNYDLKNIEHLILPHLTTWLLSHNFVDKNFSIIWDDINNLKSYVWAFNDIDTVYHLATKSNVRHPNDNEEEFTNNVLGTLNVLEVMRKKDIKEIVFTSTSAVYNDNIERLSPETAPTKSYSLFATSKLCAEMYINVYCELYGIKAWVFRIANVVGDRCSHGVVVDFINKLKNNPKTLEILGDGNQTKSYIYVSDCISAMLKIPKKPIEENFNLYNIATYDQINVKKVAEIVSDEMGLKPELTFRGGKSGWRGDVPIIKMSIKKALETGWKPRYKCEKAIRRAVREYE